MILPAGRPALPSAYPGPGPLPGVRISAGFAPHR